MTALQALTLAVPLAGVSALAFMLEDKAAQWSQGFELVGLATLAASLGATAAAFALAWFW